MASLYFLGSRNKVSRRRISNFIECKDSGRKILYSYATNAIAIILDYSVEGVHDTWKDGVLYCNGDKQYKAEGSIEYASMEERLLYHSKNNGMEIHLFMGEIFNEYQYCGIFNLVKLPYQEKESNENEQECFRWVFPLGAARGLVFKIPQRYVIESRVNRDIREQFNKETSAIVKYEEKLFLDEVNYMDFSDEEVSFEYKGESKERIESREINGQKIYIRDKKTAFNALSHANFLCEIDKTHPTFIRRNSNKNYTEPHHLVPMAFSYMFDVSLDVEENIVSLCSNCHNQIHYGKGADAILKFLYEERKELLKAVGINISFEELRLMYELE